MPKSFKQKLCESLDRVVLEDFGAIPPEVNQAIYKVLKRINKKDYMSPTTQYGEDFADRLREEWIDRGGIVNNNIEQELYDIADDLITSDAELQHERNMSDPPISQAEQYRSASIQKYGPKYGYGW